MAGRERLAALDAFRGLTVAAMILVNNPGEWDAVYPPLRHADFNGCTLADLIFPFFLFITGLTTAISVAGDVRPSWRRVAKRTLLIFGLGLFLNGFPLFDWSTLRIPGVLQRIAVCYAAAAILVRLSSARAQMILFVGIVAGYAVALECIPVPGATAGVIAPDANLAAWLDVRLLRGHLLHDHWDPEGVLSTFPALATTLCGVLAAHWLRSSYRREQQALVLGAVGVVMAVLGCCLSPFCPINKTVWSSSFVLVSGGAALCGLALCVWLIDVRRSRRWAQPFIAYGRNPIVAYVLSTLIAKQLLLWPVVQTDGTPTNAASYIFRRIFLPLAQPVMASLLYAATYTALWLLVATVLYRRGVLIRV